MGLNLTITDRKHYSGIKNDLDFSQNLGDFFTHQKGSVMEFQKIIYTLDLSWDDFSSASNRWYVESGNTLRRTSGSWIKKGFSIGDTIDLWKGFTATWIFQDRLITNITKDIIVFDGAAIPDEDADSYILYGGKTDAFGLEYSFGIIPQSDPAEFKSLLDGSDQTYYANNIGIDNGGGRITTFIDGIGKSNISSWITGSFKVRFVSRPSTYIQTFEIEHIYRINPYFEDGEFEDLQNGVLPEKLEGNNTLRYVSNFDFRTNLSNPNTSKIKVDDIQLGSVAGFGESFNGYKLNHAIDSVVYTDIATATTTSKLNVSSNTRVNFNISTTDSIFVVGSPLIMYHSYLPDLDVYEKKQDDFNTIWLVEDARNLVDAAPFDGNFIKQFTITRVDDNNVEVSCELHFTATEREKIQEGYKYLLAIGVADSTLTNDNDLSKGILLVNANEYEKDSNIVDLVVNEEFGFVPYYEFESSIPALFTDIKDFNQGLFKHSNTFKINRTASKDAKIVGLKYLLVAFNDTTTEWFELQREVFDLTQGQTLPIGTYNANPWEIEYHLIEKFRDYNLADGDEFNFLRLDTLDNDGTYQRYKMGVGFLINWQDWIALNNADTVFFDVNEPNNGLNNKASTYSLKNGYSIRVISQIDMQGLDEFGNIGETTTNIISNPFSIFDFGEQDDDPTIWSAEIKLYDENNVELAGNNLGNSEITKIHAIYTDTVRPNVGNISEYWGRISLEESGQLGFDLSIISSTKNPQNKSVNRLQGRPVLAEVEKTSNTVITVKADTSHLNLINGINYNVYGELRNITQPPVIYEWVFKTEIDVPTDGTFNPSVTVTGGEVPTWTLVDGYFQTTTAFSKGDRTSLSANELNGVCQDVVMTFSTNNPDNITGLNLGNTLQNVYACSDVNLTIFNYLKNITFNESNIDSIVFSPNQAVDIISIYLNLIPNLTTIDYSPIGSFFGGNIQAILCPLLANLTFPSSSKDIIRLGFDECALVTVDLSPLTGLGTSSGAGGDIEFKKNSLTSIIFPNSSNNIRKLLVRENNLTTLDISGLSGLNGAVDAPFNNLTSVTFNANTKFGVGVGVTSGCKLNINDLGFVDFSVITANNDSCQIQLNSNKINAANAQQIIEDLNATGWINGTLLLQSQSPTLTSGEIATIQASASYINLDTVLNWTITI